MSPEYMQALIAGAGMPTGSSQGRAKFVNGRFQLDEPQQKKKKNFWLDQLSTGLGIAGGIGGSFIAPLAGTAAGAGAGSALGEAIENLITGDSVGKNVVKEGAMGAVFGAGPIRLLKGGAALATGKGVQAASQAAMTPLRQKAGQSLVNASDDLTIKQFRLNPSQLSNFKKKFGEDAGKVIKRYGFQSADDITSKGIQPLQTTFDDIVNQVGAVSKDDIAKSLQSKYTPLLKSAVQDNRKIGQALKQQSDDLLKRFGEVVDAKELNVIRKEFDQLVNYTEKVANPSRYGINKRSADALRTVLQKSGEKQGLPLKEVGRELQKLRQLSDNALKQAELGRGSLPFSLGNVPGAIMGAGAGGPAGGAVGFVANAAANSPTGRRLMATGAEQLGSRLVNQGTKELTKKGIAGRLGAAGAVSGIANQTQAESLEDAMMNQLPLENSSTTPMTMNTRTNIPNSSNIMDTQYQNQGGLSSGITRESALQAMMEDIQTTGGKNVEKIMAIYEFANPETEQAAQKPLSQGQQERADLINALGLTEQAVDGGSINFGPVGSRIEGFKSMFNQADPETLAYKNTVSGLRAAITKARAGASLTAGELKMLEKYTPSETDSEQVVRSKLAQLRALYGYQAPTGGGMTLEDALMQSQFAQ